MQRSGFECHFPRDEVKQIVWPHGENIFNLDDISSRYIFRF